MHHPNPLLGHLSAALKDLPSGRLRILFRIGSIISTMLALFSIAITNYLLFRSSVPAAVVRKVPERLGNLYAGFLVLAFLSFGIAQWLEGRRVEGSAQSRVLR